VQPAAGAGTGAVQQQAKLVGTGALGAALQGVSVSLSSDGNTAIVGGWGDNNDVGAAWVFTRSRGVWGQQAKLVGTGALGAANQGVSVSLSGDGNTAIIGGPDDDNRDGAAWVFTRSRGVWGQQAKLVGTGAVGPASQGFSVSLCDDGNTAVVGGPGDNNDAGAAWVYTRSRGMWSQQGPKLVGTDAVGPFAEQGRSVSLSGEGNRVIVGGPFDNNDAGTAWVYTRSRGVRSQQGPKLVGTDGKSVSALAQQYGGLNAAAAALGYSSVQVLQNAIAVYCAG
jgi:FG-GAP repeat